jgi:hypothetical protein
MKDDKVDVNYEAPDFIEMKDNTNTKVNTFTYEKLELTEAEIEKEIGKERLEEYKKAQNGELRVLYRGVGAKVDDGSLITQNDEVYILELKKDGENDNQTCEYRLEQYRGMTGSGHTSMQWANRAKRKGR